MLLRLSLASLLLSTAGFALPEKKEEAKPAPASPAPELPASPVAVEGLPAKPLDLKTPAAPPAKIEELDLKTEEPDALRSYVNQAIEGESLDDAYALLYWAHRRSSDAGDMEGLARLCALRDKIDDAFYWLQRSVLEDRYDDEDMSADTAFKKVRDDKRFATLEKFADEAKAAWKKSGHLRTVVTVPKDAKPGTPVPVFIALHGLGAYPENFGRSGDLQEVADEVGAAFVSVSGTEPWGQNIFSWKENFESDWQHIQKALESDRKSVV